MYVQQLWLVRNCYDYFYVVRPVLGSTGRTIMLSCVCQLRYVMALDTCNLLGPDLVMIAANGQDYLGLMLRNGRTTQVFLAAPARALLRRCHRQVPAELGAVCWETPGCAAFIYYGRCGYMNCQRRLLISTVHDPVGVCLYWKSPLADHVIHRKPRTVLLVHGMGGQIHCNATCTAAAAGPRVCARNCCRCQMAGMCLSLLKSFCNNT